MIKVLPAGCHVGCDWLLRAVIIPFTRQRASIVQQCLCIHVASITKCQRNTVTHQSNTSLQWCLDLWAVRVRIPVRVRVLQLTDVLQLQAKLCFQKLNQIENRSFSRDFSRVKAGCLNSQGIEGHMTRRESFFWGKNREDQISLVQDCSSNVMPVFSCLSWCISSPICLCLFLFPRNTFKHFFSIFVYSSESDDPQTWPCRGKHEEWGGQWGISFWAIYVIWKW